MSNYTIKHSCGHEREYQLFGSRSDRDRKVKWLEEQECPDCRKKWFTDEAERRGYPVLTGSPKQVSWANEIRYYAISGLEAACDKAQTSRYERISKEDADLAMEYFMKQTSAGWWIDHRDDGSKSLVKLAKQVMEEERKDCSPEAILAAEEVLLEPEERKTTVECEVKYTDQTVYTISEKDDTIRTTLKEAGFRWNPDRMVWMKAISETTGSASDRGKDIANRLLRAGVPVVVPAEWVEDVKAARFEPEWRDWLRYEKSRDGGSFVIPYPYDRRDLELAFSKVRKEYGVGYVVPGSLWREVDDFASLNGYKLARSAAEFLEEQKAKTVMVAPEKPVAAPKADGEGNLKAILESPRDVLEDLLDED